MKSRFNKLFYLIMEELNKRQKQLTDTYTVKRDKNLSFGPIFKEERTYFPLKLQDIEDLKPSQEIKQQLDNAGFYISNYRNGIALKKQDKLEKQDLRQIKIGKILNRLNKPELIKQFNERLVANIKNINKNLLICITHNPYDIAGMSTGRNWTSCMHLDEGEYYQTPLLEVQYGGMCAYLIDQNDKLIQHPYTRIAIKRFISKDDQSKFIFKAEQRIYGDRLFAQDLKFDVQVSDILNKSNQQTLGQLFQFQRDENQSRAYSDSCFGTEIYIKDIDTLKQQINNGLNLKPDIFNQIAKLGKADYNFVMKYINKFSNLAYLLNNKFTVQQLSNILENYCKVWYPHRFLNKEQLNTWKRNIFSIYNQKHGTNYQLNI